MNARMKIPAIRVTGDRVSTDAEVGASERPEVDTYLVQSLEAQNQDHPISAQTAPGKVNATAPLSQSSTEIPRLASPQSDATVINTEPAKSLFLASTEQQTGRVLVPTSSPAVDNTAANAKDKSQPQDAIDDVETTAEPSRCAEESDPIEAEPSQHSDNQPAPSQNINSVSRKPHKRAPRTALNPPHVAEQPARRSGRLANRQSSVGTSEATLVPLTQVRQKVTSALIQAITSKEDDERICDGMKEAARDKSVPKQGGKSAIKSARSTSLHPGDSGDDTSPSVAHEDGSPRALASSQVKWTTQPLSEQTQPDASSVIDELRSSSQGHPRILSQGRKESSIFEAENKTPAPIRRGATIPSRGRKGGAQPLFLPGSSQALRAPLESSSESENEPTTATPLLPKKTLTRSTPGSGIQFRRLSDIASKETIFSNSKAAQRRFKMTPSFKVQPRFNASDDGEDDEESSSSSDGAVANSHIPKERRAGAGTGRKGKRQGLSSLGD